MNGHRVAALACLIGGLALLAYGVSVGQAQVGLLLFIPYVVGSGIIPLLAMLLFVGAFVFWTMGTFRAFRDAAGSYDAGATSYREPRTRDDADARTPPPAYEAFRGDQERRTRRTSKSGGVILLGPIPIVWGSDRRILPWMVGAGLLLLVLALLLTWR